MRKGLDPIGTWDFIAASTWPAGSLNFLLPQDADGDQFRFRYYLITQGRHKYQFTLPSGQSRCE